MAAGLKVDPLTDDFTVIINSADMSLRRQATPHSDLGILCAIKDEVIGRILFYKVAGCGRVMALLQVKQLSLLGKACALEVCGGNCKFRTFRVSEICKMRGYDLH